MTWIGLLAGLSLTLTGSPRAETVTTRADRGVLGTARDGRPYVAFTVGRNLELTVRAAGGGWKTIRLGRLPGPDVALAGIRISERPHRFVSVLAADTKGRWLTLARGSRITSIARAARGSRFGPAGLGLDAAERPAVAYAVQRASSQTYLRLVTFDRSGRRRVQAITRGGFPSSSTLPAAVPVLVGGRMHVVETYASGAIDWGPKSGGGWEGQFLFSSRLGTPAGPVGATFRAPTLHAAWTQSYPDDTSVLLTSSASTQETVTLTHGSFVSIIRGSSEPEVGALDWVDLTDDWREYAALVIQGTGSAAWQLDGRLEGYASAGGDARQVLLSRDRGLEWFQTLAPAAYGIELQMAVDETGKVAGSVVGQTASGTVDIYLERAHGPRELVARAPVAADSSFTAQVNPTPPGTVYRGVYEDPRSGLPFAALPGVPVGVSG